MTQASDTHLPGSSAGLEDALSDLIATVAEQRHSFSLAALDSVLDRCITITDFRDVKAKRKREREITVRELVDWIPEQSAPTKDELPLFKMGRFGNQKTNHGSLRHDANFIGFDGIEIDYDGESVSMETFAARMRQRGVAGVLYTSPSHMPDRPRYRCLIPTSEFLKPSRHRDLVRFFDSIVGHIIADESLTLSQSYYVGRAERIKDKHTLRIRKGHPVEIIVVKGQAIDLCYDEVIVKGGFQTEGGRSLDADGEYAGEPGSATTLTSIRDIFQRYPVRRWDSNYPEWLVLGLVCYNESNGRPEGKALWIEASQRCDKFDLDEINRKWRSFRRKADKRVGFGTLRYLAKLYAPAANLAGELTFETPGECGSVPMPDYVIKGLISLGNIGCLFGAPGAGKSLLGPYLGYQVALGEHAFGLRTKAGTVFYIAAEDISGMRKRVQALYARQDDAPRFHLVGGVSDLFSEENATLEKLIAEAVVRRPSLIIIDTMAMAFPGLEENDSKSMGRVISVCRQLADTGAAVMLIHHDTKSESMTPRGHSILNGALDFAIHVKREDGRIRGKLTKNKNGPCDIGLSFQIDIEEFGLDEDGDMSTAAVLSEVHESGLSASQRLSPAQREAKNILLELEAVGSVSEHAWRDACVDSRRVSQSEDPDNRRRAFNMVRKKLFEAELIGFSDGDVFLRNTNPDEDD